VSEAAALTLLLVLVVGASTFVEEEVDEAIAVRLCSDFRLDTRGSIGPDFVS
jgi:hypothetical protein